MPKCDSPPLLDAFDAEIGKPDARMLPGAANTTLGCVVGDGTLGRKEELRRGGAHRRFNGRASHTRVRYRRWEIWRLTELLEIIAADRR